MSGYRKVCYWLNQKELDDFRGSLKKGELPLDEETRIPCRVLSRFHMKASDFK